MDNYNILAKVNYSFEQNNSCVLIKQFLIAQSQGQKVLLLKMQNNFSQRLNFIKYVIHQLNSKGVEVGKTIFEYDNFQASPNAIFAPYKSIVLHKDCSNIKAELIQAIFEKYTYNKEEVKEQENNINKVEQDFYMKERKPKIPAILPVLVSLFFVGISVATFFAVEEYKNTHYEFSIDDFEYRLINKSFEEDGDIILTRYNGRAKNVKIPEKVLEHSIIGIDESAFSESNVEKVVIESKLDSFTIGDNAFKDCRNLKSVSFGNISEIGDYAFIGCEQLTNIELKDLESIGTMAFAYSGITSIKIQGDNPLKLGNGVFSNCYKLETAIIDQKIDFNYLNSELFSQCGSLKELSLKNSGSLDGKQSFSISTMLGNTNMSLQKLNIEEVNEICYGFCQNLPVSTVKIGKLNSPVIGEYAFSGCVNLTKLSLPRKIKTVNAYAFAYSGIEIFDFSEVESFGDCAFSGTYITTAKLNSKVTSLPFGLFSNCLNLQEVSLDSNIETIPDELFMNCHSINRLDIDLKNVTSIGNNAFFACSMLPSIDFSKSLSFIGERAFEGCHSLQSINIPYKVSEIKSRTFADCSSLSKVTFDKVSNITNIGDSAFINCSSLESIDLSGFLYLNDIGTYAFYNCNSLSTVLFPKDCSLLRLSEGVFKNCNFSKFSVPEYIVYIEKEALAECSNLKTVILNESISIIQDRSFADCVSLSKIDIPLSINQIGENIFENCTSIKQLVVPLASSNISEPASMKYLFGQTDPKDLSLESIEIHYARHIDDYAFENYEGLKSIKLSGSVRQIGNGAFTNCKSLESLTLSDKVSEIGSEIFKGCESLKELQLPFIGYNENSSTTLNDMFGVENSIGNSTLEKIKITNAKSLENYALRGFTALKNIDISEGLETIGLNAFYNCEALETIVIPSSVIYMGEYIFQGCNSIKEMSLPFIGSTISSPNQLSYLFGYNTTVNSLDKIELTNVERLTSSTFSGYEINEIVLSETLKTVDSYAFAHISGLQELVIPTSVTDMGNAILYECIDLQSLVIPFIGYNRSNPYQLRELYGWSYIDNLKTIEITDATSLQSYMFDGCASLEKVVLNEGLRKIPQSAFQYCYSLSEVVLPSTLRTIENEAFISCKSLNEISIPRNVREIQSNAFNGCDSLFSVRNYSSLNIQVGNWNNGGVALYAYEVLIGDEPTSLVYHNEGDYKFIYYDKKWKLIKCFSKDSEITLPSGFEYDGQEVNQYEINNYLLYFKNSIEKVTIPSSVTVIGEGSFSSMNFLKEVVFDENCPVTNIPNNTFSDDVNLETVTLPKNLNQIGSYAFNNCQSLNTFTVTEKINLIDYGAFNNCSSLYDVLNLSTLKIKKGSSDHGEIAYNAIVVRESSSQEQIRFIEDGDYKYAYSNNELYLIKYIGDNWKTNITLPSSVKIDGKTYDKYQIHNKAFEYCNMSSVHISNAVTSIGQNAFAQCYSLNEVTFDSNVNLELIGNYAFSSCQSLEKFGDVKSVKKIGNYSFAWCNKLENLPTFEGLEHIGNSAFYACSSLRRIVLPESLTTIEYNAFYECNKLLEVVDLSPNLSIKKGDTEYGYVAYYALIVNTSLTDIAIEYYESDGFEFIYYDGQAILLSFENIYGSNEITLPSTVTINGKIINSYEIGTDAFKYEYFTKVTIPSSVTKIGKGAFSQCSSLQEVVFEDESNLTIIDENAFSNCVQLRRFVIPSSVLEIRTSAFYYCTRLAELVVGESVSNINYYAFEHTPSLSVIYNYSSLQLESSEFSNTYITKNAIKIYGKETPYKEMPLYDYNNALFGKIDNQWYLLSFEGYESEWKMPTSFNYQNELVDQYIISSNVLTYAYSLNTIFIPLEVVGINQNAFSNAYNLNTIYYMGSQKQWNEIQNFDNSLKTKYIYYYSSCVHDETQWTYEANGTISHVVNYVDWQVKTKPTCQKEGEEAGLCFVCNKEVSRPIAKVAHEYENLTCKYCGKTEVIANSNNFASLFNNDAAYPFIIDSQGIITSNNKTDSTMATLVYVATNNVKVSFEYKTSSETSCDRLMINTYLNGIQSCIADISGETDYMYAEIELNAGDSISFIYSKDGSVSIGKDCCYIQNFTIA